MDTHEIYRLAGLDDLPDVMDMTDQGLPDQGLAVWDAAHALAVAQIRVVAITSAAKLLDVHHACGHVSLSTVTEMQKRLEASAAEHTKAVRFLETVWDTASPPTGLRR